MAMIRPTLILDMDLDERSFTDELAADLKRAYTHVAASRITSHPASEGAVEDVIRMNVKMNKPYWDAAMEGADEQWQGVMPKWLGNMFYKVSANMKAFSRMRAERGEQGVTFSWLELDFVGNVVVSIRLNADSSIPEDALAWVERARDLLNEGALGEGVVRVSIPSEASYAAQAEPHTARREIVEESAAGVDSPENEAAEDVEAGASATVESASSVAPAVHVFYEVEPFDIDYSTWGVTRADGTAEEYDA